MSAVSGERDLPKRLRGTVFAGIRIMRDKREHHPGGLWN